MDNSHINKKERYKRPGVIEGESSIGDSGDGEVMRLLSDGPSGGDQLARGLDPKSPRGKSQEGQEQYRIVIEKEANDCLERIVAKANQGFENGAVNRSGIANYVFQNLAKLLSDADLKAIRALYFDDKRVLGTILKSDEDLPEELRRALREYYGISDGAKKRALRAAPELSPEKSEI